MGCDFAYSDAVINYKNMDKLIAYMNANQQVYNMTLMVRSNLSPSFVVEHFLVEHTLDLC